VFPDVKLFNESASGNLITKMIRFVGRMTLQNIRTLEGIDMKTIFQTLVLALGLSIGANANAHFVWVVKAGDKVQLHFSESAESSEPELLKNIASAKVWAQVAGDQGDSKAVEVPLTLTTDSLSGDVDAKATSVVVSHDYGVVSKGEATFLLKYLAKQHSSPLSGQWNAVNDLERMPLEVTPSWSGRKLKLSVTLNGQPASGLEVKAAGCGIDETLTTDDHGMVECNPVSNGVLSVRSKYVAEKSGELNGEKYDSIRTYSTLTLPLSLPVVELVSHEMPALSQGITSFGAAVAGDQLYVYGGHFGDAHHYSEAGQSNELRCISLTAKDAKWEQLPGGPKLTGLAMVEHDGKLYRVGGFTAKNKADEDQSLWSQDSFACFDPATGEWTDLPAMPSGRSSHDVAVVDGKLYVVGGWNMQGADSTVWHTTALVCDLTQPELKWIETAAPPFQRRAVSVAAFQGKLYVIGGMTESGSTTTEVSVFDPASNAWTVAPALNGTGMEGFGTSSFAANNRLVVTSMSGAVQVLSDDATKWIPAGQVREARFFHRQLTTADGRILLVGGASMQTGKTSTIELLQFVAKP
jgi:N-acetylneuraminic acid mutarotase/uncharacterized GH25 family protein